MTNPRRRRGRWTRPRCARLGHAWRLGPPTHALRGASPPPPSAAAPPAPPPRRTSCGTPPLRAGAPCFAGDPAHYASLRARIGLASLDSRLDAATSARFARRPLRGASRVPPRFAYASLGGGGGFAPRDGGRRWGAGGFGALRSAALRSVCSPPFGPPAAPPVLGVRFAGRLGAGGTPVPPARPGSATLASLAASPGGSPSAPLRSAARCACDAVVAGIASRGRPSVAPDTACCAGLRRRSLARLRRLGTAYRPPSMAAVVTASVTARPIGQQRGRLSGLPLEQLAQGLDPLPDMIRRRYRQLRRQP